jgi:A/G-specific adenine glycosylase
VISRVFRVQTLLPKGKADIRDCEATLVRAGRCGDYGQALMDLGGNVCTPRNPKCDECPWQDFCAAHVVGDMEDYPKKAPKKKLPMRHGAVFVLRHADKILLERRADAGLLGGMMGFMGTPWGDVPDDPLSYAPQNRNWEKLDGEVQHIFTHFDLRLTIYTAETADINIVKADNQLWVPLNTISDYGLPTVFKKVLHMAIKNPP